MTVSLEELEAATGPLTGRAHGPAARHRAVNPASTEDIPMSDAETLPTLEHVTNALKHNQAEVDGAAVVRAFLADLAPDLTAAKRAVQESTAAAQEIAPQLAEIDRHLSGVGQVGGRAGVALHHARNYRQDVGKILETAGKDRGTIAAIEATTPELLACRLHPGADARLTLAMIVARPRDLRAFFADMNDQLRQFRQWATAESVVHTVSAGPMPTMHEARPTFAVSDTAERDR
jgi:hypothetical protein